VTFGKLDFNGGTSHLNHVPFGDCSYNLCCHKFSNSYEAAAAPLTISMISRVIAA
jgi:hypothetical protein